MTDLYTIDYKELTNYRDKIEHQGVTDEKELMDVLDRCRYALIVDEEIASYPTFERLADIVFFVVLTTVFLGGVFIGFLLDLVW